MKFLVIHKDRIENMPPLMSAILILNELGYQVHLITTGISNANLMSFQHKGINCTIVNQSGASNPLSKVVQYLCFRLEIKHILKNMNFDIMWIEGANTIRALGGMVSKYKYILQISELHENSRSQLKAIKNVIDRAEFVFMPEYNRTVFYQIWFKLSKRPIVLPNKPYFIPTIEVLSSLKEKYRKMSSFFENNKVILYQGHIHKERDLSPFAMAVKQLGDNYKLVLMGKDHGALKKYREILPSVVHIDFIPAPDYLLLTSLAHIGIVCYDACQLNTAYCAPNKIYEYGAFSKPMIGNNIPGLQVIIQNNAGLLVDDSNIDSIISAIRKIDEKYDSYTEGSWHLFDNINNKQTIKNALAKL